MAKSVFTHGTKVYQLDKTAKFWQLNEKYSSDSVP